MNTEQGKVHWLKRPRMNPVFTWDTACGLTYDIKSAHRAKVTIESALEGVTCENCKRTVAYKKRKQL